MNASQIFTLAAVFWSPPNIQNHSLAALAILLPADAAPGCFIRSCQISPITKNTFISIGKESGFSVKSSRQSHANPNCI